MHLHFTDDSGTILPPNRTDQKYFVLGGPVVPEEQWHNLEKEYSEICSHFAVKGEIKWRFFGQKEGFRDKGNTISHLNHHERDELRETLLRALVAHKSIKIINVVVHLPTIYQSPEYKIPEQVHGYAHKSLMDIFQLHLHDLSQQIGSAVYGMIISDHRNPIEDRAHRDLHRNILKTKDNTPITYPNLIEGLFFSPSDHSIGIQFADLVSGAIFRFYEHRDDRWYNLLRMNLWKPETKQSEGMLSKLGFRKEKDAESVESFNPTEPT